MKPDETVSVRGRLRNNAALGSTLVHFLLFLLQVPAHPGGIFS